MNEGFDYPWQDTKLPMARRMVLFIEDIGSYPHAELNSSFFIDEACKLLQEYHKKPGGIVHFTHLLLDAYYTGQDKEGIVVAVRKPGQDETSVFNAIADDTGITAWRSCPCILVDATKSPWGDT